MAEINSTVCYFPNGRSTQSQDSVYNHVPCDPSAAHSACCIQGDSCTATGLCYDGHGHFYRSGCTDKSWDSPACSQVCNGLGNEGQKRGKKDSTTYVRSCETSVSNDPPPTWSCAVVVDGGAFDCNSSSTRPFSIDIGSIVQKEITGNYEAPDANTTTSCPVSSTSMSSSDSCTNPAAVGAGVGVPLGLCALLAVGWALWERRNRRTHGRRLSETASASELNKMEQAKTGYISPAEQSYNPSYDQSHQETSAAQETAEMYSNEPRYELYNDHGR